MNSFWPKGITVTDAMTPLDYLKLADKEWRNKSENKLSLVTQSFLEYEYGVYIDIAYDDSITISADRLLFVIKVPKEQGKYYPAEILLNGDADRTTGLLNSYSEFERALIDVLNSSHVKSTVSNFVIGICRAGLSVWTG
jgi:hypothetical protein